MQPSFTVKKSVWATGQNRSHDFGFSINNRHDHALIWLTFKLFNQKLGNGQIFDKFKPLNIWIKMIFWTFTPAKIVIYQSIHSSDLVSFLTRVWKFSCLSNKFEVWVFCQIPCLGLYTYYTELESYTFVPLNCIVVKVRNRSCPAVSLKM